MIATTGTKPRQPTEMFQIPDNLRTRRTNKDFRQQNAVRSSSIPLLRILRPSRHGAKQSALSKAELRRILTAHTAALLEELLAPEIRVQIANGSMDQYGNKFFSVSSLGAKCSRKRSLYYLPWVTSSKECPLSRSFR